MTDRNRAKSLRLKSKFSSNSCSESILLSCISYLPFQICYYSAGSVISPCLILRDFKQRVHDSRKFRLKIIKKYHRIEILPDSIISYRQIKNNVSDATTPISRQFSLKPSFFCVMILRNCKIKKHETSEVRLWTEAVVEVRTGQRISVRTETYIGPVCNQESVWPLSTLSIREIR